MRVEIWSDIACPWCYIGKRRFESALSQFEGRDEVRVIWRSFELDPAAPHERQGERAAHLADKYGTTLEQAQRMQRQMTEIAAGEGLQFRFDIARSGRTFDGHRVVHLAADHGLQDAMKERLLSAYLTEGELVADHETLAGLAAQVGLSENEVCEMLATEHYAGRVRSDESAAAQLGITAVPTFVVDRAVAAAGAHPPAALLDLLRRGRQLRPAQAAARAGDRCGVDDC